MVQSSLLEDYIKHLPKTQKFYKVFNKNCVKLSYSSMRNIASIISSHNESVLRLIIQDHRCNCRQKNDCPMQNKYIVSNTKYSIRSYSYEQRRHRRKDIFWIM